MLKLALGDEKAYATPVSSTRRDRRHPRRLGALEAIFTILALRRGAFPTINQTSADPDCDLDYVAHTARREQAKVAISNSFGFGGHNTALVFRRLAEADETPSQLG